MLSKKNNPQILIVAGEASSALYAQRLLEYWKSQDVNVRAFGVGSREMESLGFEILGRSEEMAVVGLTEVLKHYKKIKQVFTNLVTVAKERQPDVVLLLDYPDFNLRLAKKMKALGLQVVYYISPQLWAWRKSRIFEIKKYVDKMLVVLPFEKDFYQSHNVAVEFVGHPLLDEISEMYFNSDERKRGRERYGISDGDTWIGLMPGSRYSEIEHHMQTQIAAAEKMYKQNQNLKFALIVAPTFSIEEFRQLLPQYSLPLILIKDDPLKMVSLVDLVLCASGTATLVVGLLGKPMVIMYKMNPVSAFLARLIVKGTQYFGLINLILNKRVVPELFQSDANPDKIAEEMLKYVDNAEYFNEVKAELLQAQKILGDKGATKRVAEVLAPLLFKK